MSAPATPTPQNTAIPGFPVLALALSISVTIGVLAALLLWFGQAFRVYQQDGSAIARMQQLRGQVLLHDEQLTMSARMAVATENTSWIDRYERVEPQLASALDQLKEVSDRFGGLESTREADKANYDRVSMERAAFQQLRNGDRSEARALLFGPAYRALKNSYSVGMTELLGQIDSAQASVEAAGESTRRELVYAMSIAFFSLVLLWWWYGQLHRRWRVEASTHSSRVISELDAAREKGEHLATALSDTEQRLEFVLNNSPLVVFALSSDGRFTYCNGAGLVAAELQPNELLGQSVWEVCARLPLMLANLRLALAGRSQRFEGKDENGRCYEIFLYPVAIDDGRYQVVGVALDITESAEARATVTMLGEVLQHSPVGTAWIGSDGRYRYVNQGFCELAGLSEQELLDKPWEFPLAKSGIEIQKAGLRSDLLATPGQQQASEIELDSAGGKRRWLKVNSVGRRIENSEGVIVVVEDITQLRHTQTELTERTYSDGATGLPSRLAMVEWLRTVLSGSNRNQCCTGALIYIDLDHFRRIHDVLGRLDADRFLREVAARLQDMVPTGGMIARSGGDEFLMYMPASGRDAVNDVVEQIRSDLNVPFEFSGSEFTVSASFGITMLPLDAKTAGEAMRAAEAAMYTAKQQGRDRGSFFQAELADRPRRLMRIETRLRAAIRAEQLEVHYQPIMQLSDLSVVGCEALLRWTDAELGEVSPGEFIPVAEELNLTSELTRMVINTAARDLGRWNRVLDRPVRMAINCSAQQLGETDFYDLMMQSTRARGLQPEQFELEVTERMVMSQSSTVSETISRLLAAGFRLAIDDFGTGYSALAYLKRYPFHTVKIDRAFIRDVSNRPADEALCRAIVGITEALHMDTVAEGLETRDQVEALREMGSGYGQGFYFAAAMPAEQFLEWVQIRNPILRKAGG